MNDAADEDSGEPPFDPQSTIVDVTDGRFADYNPVFTLDGLYLAFLSRRTFDPIYDAHSFDLSFRSASVPTWYRWPPRLSPRSARAQVAAQSTPQKRKREPNAPGLQSISTASPPGSSASRLTRAGTTAWPP